jgi:hypothetical protein
MKKEIRMLKKELSDSLNKNAYDYYLDQMKEKRASKKQIGGDHYKDCLIQPVEYIHKNKLDYFEGNVVKYITRHRKKGDGRKDIEKVIHYAQLILELDYGEGE